MPKDSNTPIRNCSDSIPENKKTAVTPAPDRRTGEDRRKGMWPLFYLFARGGDHRHQGDRRNHDNSHENNDHPVPEKRKDHDRRREKVHVGSLHHLNIIDRRDKVRRG